MKWAPMSWLISFTRGNHRGSMARSANSGFTSGTQNPSTCSRASASAATTALRVNSL